MIELESYSGRRRDLQDRGTRSWIVLDTGENPALTGEDPNTKAGAFTAKCGECGDILVSQVDESGVSGYVIKCPSCSAYNDLQDPEKYL